MTSEITIPVAEVTPVLEISESLVEMEVEKPVFEALKPSELNVFFGRGNL